MVFDNETEKGKRIWALSQFLVKKNILDHNELHQLNNRIELVYLENDRENALFLVALTLKKPLTIDIWNALYEGFQDAEGAELRITFQEDATFFKDGSTKSSVTLAIIKDYFKSFFGKDKKYRILLEQELTHPNFLSYSNHELKANCQSQELDQWLIEQRQAFIKWMHQAGFTHFGFVSLFNPPAEKQLKVKSMKVSKYDKQFETEVFSTEFVPIHKINQQMDEIKLMGQIFELKDFPGYNNLRNTLNIYVTDFQLGGSLILKWFYKDPKTIEGIKIGTWVKATVKVERDAKTQLLQGIIKEISPIETPAYYRRPDQDKQKRVELVFHTKMSAFDGINSVQEYAQFAKERDWKTIAVTDKDNIHIYPTLYEVAKKYGLKAIYGLECNLIDDHIKIVSNPDKTKLKDATFVIFDIETTGLHGRYDSVIEFAGIKVKHNREVERMQFFLKIDGPLPAAVTEITKITQAQLEDGMEQQAGLEKLRAWLDGCVMVAHNGLSFDLPFLQTQFEKYNIAPLTNPLIDTLALSWALNPGFASHTLSNICAKLKFDFDDERLHRADYDTQALKKVFDYFKEQVELMGITNLEQLDQELNQQCHFELLKRTFTNTGIIYIKSQSGFAKLYELLSIALTDNNATRPLVLTSTLQKFAKSFVITDNPVQGDIFKAALTKPLKELEAAIKRVDFVLIAPPGAYAGYTIREGLKKEAIPNAIKLVVDTAQRLNKLVAVASDAYFIHPWENEYYKAIVCAKGLGGRWHRHFNYKEREQRVPNVFVRTTGEMLNEMSFLGEQLAYELVVENTNKLAKQLTADDLVPVQTKLQPPVIEGSNENLAAKTWSQAKAIYGDPLPKLIEQRIQEELKAIIDNGFGIIYWISHLLVKQSVQDGYFVGPRGSIGSSLVANLIGISEINPLVPHYLCESCQYFEVNEEVDDGYDLMVRDCPKCGAKAAFKGDGHNIPFATFMGFAGDKIPDIDLNFSSEYQAKAHAYVRELFGEQYTFRAGTIATVAEKTAYGYARNYFEIIKQTELATAPEIERFKQKLVGIKRTTGQHPGGIMIFPNHKSVYEFTPCGYPADDTSSDWKTTHFEYDALGDTILKLDILGQDDPTMLKHLADLTHVNPQNIPRFDKKLTEMFWSVNPLKLKPHYLDEPTGAIGIPEFGTKFVRKILEQTKPKGFGDLIRVSGLSHGKNVWADNAQKILKDQNLSLKDVIACRDDIMLYLIHKGMQAKDAFEIMEKVRKGIALNAKEVQLMQSNGVEQHWINSCLKISYLFPKAHAAAYVLMAWRIAWFKLYHPLSYYACLLSFKLKEHDVSGFKSGVSFVKQKLEELNTLYRIKRIKPKEAELLTSYEVYLEMMARGIKLEQISLTHSHATRFVEHNGMLIAPFITIPGMGEAVANSIIEARNEKPFSSLDDFKKRTKITKKHIEAFTQMQLLDEFREQDNQKKLF